MAWFEGRRCEDCNQQWDEISASRSVVVGTIDWRAPNSYSHSTCPSCRTTLRVQRETDGNAWRGWLRTLPPVPRDECEQLQREAADLVSALLQRLGSLYRPIAIRLQPMLCPRCKVLLVPGALPPPPPECPACGSTRSKPSGSAGFVSMGPAT